jgi:hypothetical protein
MRPLIVSDGRSHIAPAIAERFIAKPTAGISACSS